LFAPKKDDIMTATFLHSLIAFRGRCHVRFTAHSLWLPFVFSGLRPIILRSADHVLHHHAVRPVWRWLPAIGKDDVLPITGG